MELESASLLSQATTVVCDAGGRYGMHPSWRDFRGEMRYYSFEPDPKECTRLQRVNTSPDVKFIPLALASEPGKRTLRLYKHRGYSSLLDLNPELAKLTHYRPGEGVMEERFDVDATTVDAFAQEEQLEVDFMKVSVVGSELDVMRGAAEQMRRSLKGLRVTAWFTQGYKGQAMFPELHRFLLEQDFFLVNLDYAGRGCPVHPCVGNPNRQKPDVDRYGVLDSCEAVYLRNRHWLDSASHGSTERLGLAHLKYASFCFLNDAPDSALNCLLAFARRPGTYSEAVKATQLYQQLRLTAVRYLGRWRTNPTDQHWKLAQATVQEVFGLPLESAHKYWELMQELECSTRDAAPFVTAAGEER